MGHYARRLGSEEFTDVRDGVIADSLSDAIKYGFDAMKEAGVDWVPLKVVPASPRQRWRMRRVLGKDPTISYPRLNRLSSEEQNLMYSGRTYLVIALAAPNSDIPPGVEVCRRWTRHKLTMNLDAAYQTAGTQYNGDALDRFVHWATEHGWTGSAVRDTVRRYVESNPSTST